MLGVTDVVIHALLFAALFFQVFALITVLDHTPTRSRSVKQKRLPTVSITVPCFNEAQTLDRTMASLLALDYPRRKLSFLLVDDGSTDNTWEIMQRYAAHPQISVYHKENGGKYTALNYGIAESRAELIGCLDADSIVPPHALKAIVAEFANDERNMAVIPSILVHSPRTLMQWMQRAEYTMGVLMRTIWTALNGNVVTPGPFSFFRREVFDTIGTYREAHHTEDHEIALRMQAHHMQIGMAPSAHVYTTTPTSYAKLFRQRKRWVYGFLRNFADYRYMLFNRSYGFVGTLVLPLGIMSVFAAVYFMLLFLMRMAEETFILGEQVAVAGLPHLSAPSFHWFFMTTNSVVFLSLVAVAITVVLIFFGKRAHGAPMRFTADIPIYLFLYGFLAPWWLAAAAYSAVRDQKPNWTAERISAQK